MSGVRTTYLPGFIIASLIAAVGAGLTGCNIVGAAYYIIHGPEKVPKQFDLPPDRPTIVFVDDRANRLPRRSLRQTIADTAQKTLLDSRTLTNVIDSRAALAVAAQDRYGEPKPITEIGRAVQAELVIYVTIDEFTLSPDGQSFAPSVSMRVKVIDVIADKRMWPTDKEGFGMTTRTPAKPGYAPSSQAQLAQDEDGAARRAGTAIAQCFIKHQASDSAILPR
jgi:hypothetical protein